MAMAVARFTGGQAEDLRRAMGFKRSENPRRAAGSVSRGWRSAASPARWPIASCCRSRPFALYVCQSATAGLIAYASGYLKVHYPAALYPALLNNQPMGFYHPATLVKDGATTQHHRHRRAGLRLGLREAQSVSACAMSTGCARRRGRPLQGKRQKAKGRTNSGRRQPAAGRRPDGRRPWEGKRQKAEGRTNIPADGNRQPADGRATAA